MSLTTRRSTLKMLSDFVPLVGVFVAIGSCERDQRSVMEAPRPLSPVAAAASPVTATISPSGDTFLNIDAVNYATDTILNAYTWPANKIANAIVVKFDLASIPQGSVITSATLNLYLDSADATIDPTYTVTVHKILNKNPDVTKATGYTYDGTNGWTPSTCCYNNIPLAQSDIGAAVDTRGIDKTLAFKQWDVTSLVQAWFSDPSTNFGLLVNSDPTKLADRFRFFASSENVVTTHRPYLTVVYTPPGTVYFNSTFEDGTLGDLSVFPGGAGTCSVTTEAARTGTKSAKCVNPTGTATGGVWYQWGNKPGEPANPALSEANGFYQRFSVMFAPGSFDNVHNGGTNSQFKVLLNRSDWHYGFVGAWFMTSWGVNYGTWPPVLKNNGDNCADTTWTWPYALQEGVWYDITTWYKRDGSTHTGHAKMWVNGSLITDSDVTPPDWKSPQPGGYGCFGTDIVADQQEFELGATYTQNTVGPFTVYVDDVEAANFPIGAAPGAAPMRQTSRRLSGSP